MTRPRPDAAFHWTSEAWGDALRCRALGAAAQHLFTSRQLALPDDAAWRAALTSVGSTPDRLMRVKQVHGNVVRVLKRGQVPETAHTQRPDGDAIVSNEAGLALAVMVADCVPILRMRSRSRRRRGDSCGLARHLRARWRDGHRGDATGVRQRPGRSDRGDRTERRAGRLSSRRLVDHVVSRGRSSAGQRRSVVHAGVETNSFSISGPPTPIS